jgi:biopolymer transport protein TolR
MASFDTGDGNKRETNFELNIVPFIDLMSVCITFLLFTAVWSQVSMIELGSSIYGKATETGQLAPPPRAEVNFKVDVRAQGYIVHIGRRAISIPKLNGEFDQERLRAEVLLIKEQYPDKEDAIISVANDLTYEDLINGMDLLLASGFPEVAVTADGG